MSLVGKLRDSNGTMMGTLLVVLQATTREGIDPTVATVLLVLVAVLGLVVGHQAGTWYAARSG
jgi:hypothetical protein